MASKKTADPAAPAKTSATKKRKSDVLIPEKGFVDANVSMVARSLAELDNFPMLSCGIPSVDFVTSGGITCGKVTELDGADKSGKTLMALFYCKEALSADPTNWVLYIDAEMSLTARFARLIGFTTDELSRMKVVQTSVAETIIATMGASLTGNFDSIEKSGDVSPDLFLGVTKPPTLIVWDSIPMSQPEKEFQQDVEENVGFSRLPRFISSRFGRIYAQAISASTPVILVNQLREKMNPMPGEKKTSTPGGRYVKHIDFARFELRRSGVPGEEIVWEHHLKVDKNKLTGDGAEASFRFAQMGGLDVAHSLIEGVAAPLGIVTKKQGGYYLYNDVNFRLREFAGKVDVDALLAQVRDASGVPHLGGHTVDRWAEKVKARVANDADKSEADDEAED